MKMYSSVFNTLRELNDFVNQKGIDKKNIVSTFQSNDGLYILMYYGE